MAKNFPLGKLPSDLLAQLLGNISGGDPRVIVGPGIGVDAAVIDMGDRYLVAKTDPITFATDQVGWYAVHVNANDVACMGGTPRWFLATLLMPEDQANEALAVFGHRDHGGRRLVATAIRNDYGGAVFNDRYA